MNKILIVAAHPDDEVLGVGATIARFIREGKEVKLLVLSDGEGSREHANGFSRLESLKSSCKVLKIVDCEAKNFPDGQFDLVGILNIAKEIEKVILDFLPDTVFTHFPHDMNQDHRITSEATIVATRVQTMGFIKNILYYEVSSSTECGSSLGFKPSLYIELQQDDVDKKHQALLAYANEIKMYPHPRSIKALEAKLVVRGSEAAYAFAEAFVVHLARV